MRLLFSKYLLRKIDYFDFFIKMGFYLSLHFQHYHLLVVE